MTPKLAARPEAPLLLVAPVGLPLAAEETVEVEVGLLFVAAGGDDVAPLAGADVAPPMGAVEAPSTSACTVWLNVPVMPVRL